MIICFPRARNGTLKLGLKYKEDTQELIILVDSGSNLPPVNHGEKHSDPYVKVRYTQNKWESARNTN
jgi:hypothetical protein